MITLAQRTSGITVLPEVLKTSLQSPYGTHDKLVGSYDLDPILRSRSCKDKNDPSLSASTFSCLNASLWAASIILLTRLDFTLFFLHNASPTTFALSEYHTNHSSKFEKPLLVLRSTHTSDSSQLWK
ncbi:hypothetical protein Tco_0686813 [Tanacetum coccineum]